jgi:regulator of replication initiation timing
MSETLDQIKKRISNAYIEDLGDYELVHIEKSDLDWLVEEVEHIQFENETIRRNHTTQERKDFNRIKQLENEIKTLKSLAKINSDGYREQTERLQAVKTANDLLHMENEEFIKALNDIIQAEGKRSVAEVLDIAKEALGEIENE